MCHKQECNWNLETCLKLQKWAGYCSTKVSELSRLPIPPVIYDFSLVGIHESVDIYAIFRFDSLHCLPSGVSKLLKEWLFNVLSDPNHSSCSTTLSSGKPIAFSMIKKLVLEQPDRCFKDSDLHASGTWLLIAFYKSEYEGSLSGFFTENGILGMVEAADYESGDNAPSFSWRDCGHIMRRIRHCPCDRGCFNVYRLQQF